MFGVSFVDVFWLVVYATLAYWIVSFVILLIVVAALSVDWLVRKKL